MTPAETPGSLLAVVPGGMTSSYFDFPLPLPTHGNQTGYRSIDSHLTVLVEPTTPGLSGHLDYFWAQQFWFDGGDGGYIGLQPDGIKKGSHIGKMVLFSIWDALDAEPQVNCEVFGGEGVGYSCRVEYQWVAGREYRLRVEEDCCDGYPDDNEWWAAWIRDLSTGEDTYIGRILVPGEWNWMKQSTNVFAEYYWHTPTCIDVPLAKVRWRSFEADDGLFSAEAVSAETYGSCAFIASAWCEHDTCFHETGVGDPDQLPEPRLPTGRVGP